MFELVIIDNPGLLRPPEHGGDLLLGLVQGRLVHIELRGLGPIVQLETGGQVFATGIYIIRSRVSINIRLERSPQFFCRDFSSERADFSDDARLDFIYIFVLVLSSVKN